MDKQENGVINDRMFRYGVFLSLALMAFGVYGLFGKNSGLKQSFIKSEPLACADAGNISIGAGQTRTVNIRSDCWSGMISTELYKDFVVYAPGEIEYCFWTNNRCLKKPVSDKGVKWFGDIRASSFRLRGKEGVAKIVVEK